MDSEWSSSQRTAGTPAAIASERALMPIVARVAELDRGAPGLRAWLREHLSRPASEPDRALRLRGLARRLLKLVCRNRQAATATVRMEAADTAMTQPGATRSALSSLSME